MSRKRKLSDTDLSIWNEVAKSIDPLSKKPVLTAGVSLKSEKKSGAAKTVQVPVKISNFEIGSKVDESPKISKSQIDPRRLHNMDRRSFDRLAKGKKEIDLTIDLHGMSLERARNHLQARLIGAHAAGLRLVLVITGKGNRTTVDEFNRPRSGVLRENLPSWVSSAPLSSIVLQLVQAQQKHGGGGAFYVYLKRAR